MKAFMPWICLVKVAILSASSVGGVQAANNGLDAYRQGNYNEAAKSLRTLAGKDPVVDYYLGQMRLNGYGQLKNDALAFRYFKQAGDKGYLPAQKIMALRALFITDDPEQAFYWYKKAADTNNDLQAQRYTAAAYLYGYGVKQNLDSAKRYYIAAAKAGDSVSQYTLADDFINSRQAANKKLGLIWLNKALAQQNPKAQVLMGKLLNEGKWLPSNKVEAMALFQAAAKQGYIPAWVALGDMAQKEDNVALAKEAYTTAANQHDASAQLALAKWYGQPNTPVFDQKLSFMWMLKAAQTGSSEAQKGLAALYKNGQGTEASAQLADEWEQKAKQTLKTERVRPRIAVASWLSNDKSPDFKDSGYALEGILTPWKNEYALKDNTYNAAPQMDTITRETLYTPQFVMINPNDIPISEFYNVLATTLSEGQEKTIILPTYALDKPLPPEAMISSSGSFIPAVVNRTSNATQSPEELFNQQYQQAILGDPIAQFNVAKRYEIGEGIAKDPLQAVRFYDLAASQQELRSHYNLALMYLNGALGKADYQRAMTLLMDAAFKGDMYAQFALARIQEQGYHDESGALVIPANLEQSMGMYYLAASNDYGPAQFRLAGMLMRNQSTDLTLADKQRQTALIKRLYEGAVKGGIDEAALPLAFYNAMDSNKDKQAKAFEVANKEAQAGNSMGALLLGMLYDRGIASPVDRNEAIKWYQKAPMNPVNAFILGTYASQGSGIGKDLTKGHALLTQASDSGFSFAYLNLAVLNKMQAQVFLPELEKALALGNNQAGLLLADYYLSQPDNDDHMKQARGIYQQFAEKGDKEAQLKLGFMAEQGLGGKADRIDAQKWYNLAAAQDQPIAQYLLGRLYQMGWLSNEPDYVAAKKWYSTAQAHYSKAAVALGFIYDTVDNDYAHAVEGYQVAALTGDPIAAFNLGLIYEKGKREQTDYKKAQAMYLKAAQAGHTQAMTQLAGIYFNGMLGGRDPEQALQWYKKAAERGNRDALYQLGLLSETGVSTKLNYEEARHYYEQAASLGNAKAMLALARMYQYGLGIEKNPQKAEDLYKKLAEEDNAYAQYQLASFYYGGGAGEHAPSHSRQLLQLAEQNGSLQARTALQWLNAQSQGHVSFIEPAIWATIPLTISQSPELLYFNALNEWNRGDENQSRIFLNRLVTQYPHYIPARRAYEQLDSQSATKRFS